MKEKILSIYFWFISLFSKPKVIIEKTSRYRNRVQWSKEYNSLDEVKKRKQAYYQANKEKFNTMRRKKRKLAKEIALAS